MVNTVPDNDPGRPLADLLANMACRWHPRGGADRRNLERHANGYLFCRVCDQPDPTDALAETL